MDCHVNLHFKTLVLFTEEKARGNCTNKRALRFHTAHALLESGGGGISNHCPIFQALQYKTLAVVFLSKLSVCVLKGIAEERFSHAFCISGSRFFYKSTL